NLVGADGRLARLIAARGGNDDLRPDIRVARERAGIGNRGKRDRIDALSQRADRLAAVVARGGDNDHALSTHLLHDIADRVRAGALPTEAHVSEHAATRA